MRLKLFLETAIVWDLKVLGKNIAVTKLFDLDECTLENSENRFGRQWGIKKSFWKFFDVVKRFVKEKKKNTRKKGWLTRFR